MTQRANFSDYQEVVCASRPSWAAGRRRIARSGRFVVRHRITATNVRENRQRPRGQVSVNRSTACRASASAPAR
jgi:hypothetical protein